MRDPLYDCLGTTSPPSLILAAASSWNSCVAPGTRAWQSRSPRMSRSSIPRRSLTLPNSRLRRRWPPPAPPPFTIAIGSPVHAGSTADGVVLRVDDIDGGIRVFRAAAVAAADAIDFPPHVTIVHPHTSGRGGQAWAALAGTGI